ncbi:MAG: DsrE family protein [Planctomycetota bacterium]|nr:DsrE family protein [Planctomycetota bacterium]
MKNAICLVLLYCCVPGCSPANRSASQSATGESSSSTVLVNVTSAVEGDKGRPQAVDMALKLAGFALDEGRSVALFFNVKGVHVPTRKLPSDLAFQDNLPIAKQLAKLIERGAEVHVCPICMKALGVEAADVMEGAQVTTRPKLFAHIGANTAVFTY